MELRQSGAGHGRAMAENSCAKLGFSNEGNGNEANSRCGVVSSYA